MAEIVFSGVTKRFGNRVVAVRDFDLEVPDGEFTILVGPSGCGKTTVLRMLAGLETVTAGEIRIEGEVVNARTPKERDIAMVFQSYALYPHMSVYRNMAFPLKRAGLPNDEIQAKVSRAASLLGISELMDRKPGTLSGGQRQRVAMGRAIVRDPKAYLMDEPLSNLDAKLRIQMRAELTRIQRRLRTTTVYVTHDQIEAMTLGDRVAVMTEGSLQQVGPPRELYRQPRNLFVAGFIGAPPMNFVPGELNDGALRTPLTTIPLDADLLGRLDGYAGRTVIVGIRPEDFEDADLVGEGREGHVFSAVIDVIEETGSDVFAHLAREPGSSMEPDLSRFLGTAHQEPDSAERPFFVVRLDASSRLGEGGPARLWLNTAGIHLFDPDTGQRITAEP